ncbi:MAG TPA: amino acid ABC transporter substrate-binding protein [Clostridia bacterium]|nr:amino acid ABC transporter substrate-binding protein [Clostridia bacterium]
MTLRKITAIALTLVFALSLCLTGGCAKPASEKRTLTLGFDAEFPPYGYMGEDGEYTGFDIDMAKALCERLGWELELVPINWDSKDMELESGTIDCIWNGFTINDREDLYTWTDAYMDNSQVFIVKADSGITDFAGLAGKIVAVQSDSSAQTALEAEENAELLASFAKLEKVGDYNTAFMELDSGAVGAIAMDIGVARYQMTGREDSFKILDQALVAEQYGIGFLLGNTELRDEVQAELMKMVEDGTFAEISIEWFGYDVCILGK